MTREQQTAAEHASTARELADWVRRGVDFASTVEYTVKLAEAVGHLAIAVEMLARDADGTADHHR